ncbi:MAG: hypothetical protein KF898_07975 [Parachlamydiales bacterium]|nr:hypothetical protein [Verrucomicrobiota bacterium]MBX3719569.1 hypothetical protein [Candidatus Acheromyda pituitae]
MNRTLKKLGIILFQITIIIAIIEFVPDFCFKQTDGFSVSRLQSAFPSDPQWDTASMPASDQTEFEKAISQKYLYLGFGGQCFAFESEDGQYVIKFFKHRLRKPQAWLFSLPLPEPLRSKCRKIHQRMLSKHYRDFSSYKLAYDSLKEESGLIAVHLNKTSDIHKSLSITDKLQISHQIDLDQTEFILQKKAKLVYPTIAQMMETGNFESARKSLHSILNLIVSRCQKGIFDEDPRIHCNVGLIGTEAIFIDVGRFKPDAKRADPQVYMHDLSLITERFKGWITKNYPALLPIFEEEMEKLDEN